MKKILLFSLLFISTESAANYYNGYSMGYVIGSSTKHCSCSYEKSKVKELEEQNKKLMIELKKCKEEE